MTVQLLTGSGDPSELEIRPRLAIFGAIVLSMAENWRLNEYDDAGQILDDLEELAGVFKLDPAEAQAAVGAQQVAPPRPNRPTPTVVVPRNGGPVQ